MKKNLFKIFLAVFATVVFSSCASRENYERPAEVAPPNLYRGTVASADSLSTGHLSWRQIFTDPVLQQHISSALANNFDILSAAQNISAAEAYLRQSKAAYQPTISAGPGFSWNSPSLNTSNSQFSNSTRRYFNTINLSANASWEADIWGRLRSLQKAQQAAYFSSVQAQNAVKSDVVAGVASTYYQILALDEQREIVRRTIKIREQNLETTRALKDAGTVTEVAVQQVEALVFNANSLLIGIETQIQLLENSLNLLKGESPKPVQRTTLAQQRPLQQVDLGYPASLLSNRPDVMQAEYNLINTFELSNAAKASFYPTLTLTGSGGLQSSDLDQLFSANSLFANVITGLTAPLLNRRQIRTQYEVSLANRERAYLNFRKTVLNAGREVSDALRMFSAQDAFISFKQKELDNYTRSVEYSQQLVNYGMANYLEVLTANINALNAELNISNAKLTKLQAGVELYQALGGGWR